MNDHAGQALPDLVPARMLNEFIYCPRLFYLEWVDGLFEHNADTAEGALVHERSDSGGGRAPGPDMANMEGWEGVARSVTLDAPSLGLVATIDVLEGAGGEVYPVDHKKGKPQPDGAPWDADRYQLAAQVLVLRENGYRAQGGFVSYRATRNRVWVQVTPDLEEAVRKQLAELRLVAASPKPPPPLVDSNKCPRCSLVGICLPDETTLLASGDAAELRPRRLIAARPNAQPLYVQDQDCTVGLKGGRVEVRRGDDVVASVRRIDLLEVALFGAARITSPALRDLAADGIPITHFTYGGWFKAMTVGIETNNIGLRIAQFRAADDLDRSLEFARRFVNAKIRNARVLLRRNGGSDCRAAVRDLARLARAADAAPDFEVLLGIEGAAARTYFGALATVLRGRSRRLRGLDFSQRTRRPPRDRANATLSFLYALLTKEATLAARRVGFDPLLGFYHRPRFGRPALALDLMEEFRPLIADSVLITLINGDRMRPGYFEERADAVVLSPVGRRTVISAFEKRMATEVQHPTFGYKVTYRRALELQARILAAALLGEIPAYRPFTTR